MTVRLVTFCSLIACGCFFASPLHAGGRHFRGWGHSGLHQWRGGCDGACAEPTTWSESFEVADCNSCGGDCGCTGGCIPMASGCGACSSGGCTSDSCGGSGSCGAGDCAGGCESCQTEWMTEPTIADPTAYASPQLESPNRSDEVTIRSAAYLSSATLTGSQLHSAATRAYQSGEFASAAELLARSVGFESADPVARYLLAASYYRLGKRDLADAMLDEAIALEANHPIQDWGRKMSRTQGHVRAWIEQERRLTKTTP